LRGGGRWGVPLPPPHESGVTGDEWLAEP
jgi:hypothetical protein